MKSKGSETVEAQTPESTPATALFTIVSPSTDAPYSCTHTHARTHAARAAGQAHEAADRAATREGKKHRKKKRSYFQRVVGGEHADVDRQTADDGGAGACGGEKPENNRKERQNA
jgi:hypothetical protein